jgi:hypothetical protein
MKVALSVHPRSDQYPLLQPLLLFDSLEPIITYDLTRSWFNLNHASSLSVSSRLKTGFVDERG